MNGSSSSRDVHWTNGISQSAQALAVFSSAKEVIDGELLWAGCGSLEKQSGIRFALPARHRISIIVGLGSICAILGQGCGYKTPT